MSEETKQQILRFVEELKVSSHKITWEEVTQRVKEKFRGQKRGLSLQMQFGSDSLTGSRNGEAHRLTNLPNFPIIKKRGQRLCSQR